MEKPIYLNDFLHMSEEEIDNTKAKFNQPNDNDNNPLEEYKKNPDIVDTQWLFWRKTQRYFNVGQNALCLLRLTYDTWLLTTVKKVTRELGVNNGVNYEGEILKQHEQYFGRVIIKYHKYHQGQGRNLRNIIDLLEVVQVLPSTYDGDNFPGYDKIKLSFNQLETIIQRNKLDWVAALENQKAVYLLTDTTNGKLYVGSATAQEGMLLSRWKAYVNNGHGGNKELIDIVNSKGFEYIKRNFQYTVLENYNQRVDDDFIRSRETYWKLVLCSKAFGYNSN